MRERARETLSRMERHEPRLARSSSEASSWARSFKDPNWFVGGPADGEGSSIVTTTVEREGVRQVLLPAFAFCVGGGGGVREGGVTLFFF